MDEEHKVSDFFIVSLIVLVMLVIIVSIILFLVYAIKGEIFTVNATKLTDNHLIDNTNKSIKTDPTDFAVDESKLDPSQNQVVQILYMDGKPVVTKVQPLVDKVPRKDEQIVLPSDQPTHKRPTVSRNEYEAISTETLGKESSSMSSLHISCRISSAKWKHNILEISLLYVSSTLIPIEMTPKIRNYESMKVLWVGEVFSVPSSDMLQLIQLEMDDDCEWMDDERLCIELELPYNQTIVASSKIKRSVKHQ